MHSSGYNTTMELGLVSNVPTPLGLFDVKMNMIDETVEGLEMHLAPTDAEIWL